MIKLNNVSFSYKKNKETLKNINLEIKEGEVVLLTGPSGCGKSTILRLLNGLIPHYYEGEIKGEVSINGVNPTTTELYDLAKLCGTVFQNPRSQFFHVDTDGELAFASENQGLDKDLILENVDKTFKRFNIDKLRHRNLFKMSGGEKQKIACASLDVMPLPLILMDEPSANLDNASTMEIASIIKMWKESGKTIVISEHRLSYIWELCDRVIVMKDGEIVKDYKNKEHLSITDNQRKVMGLRSLSPVLSLNKTYKTDKNFSINDLYFSYNKKTPVLDIKELNIPLNCITAIKASNGRGKTTLLRCLSGMEKKCRFTAYLDGKKVSHKDIKKHVFMVTQDVNHQLFTESVLEEVLISQKNEDENIAHDILKFLDLDEYASRHPLSLSGGQKQRVAVSSAVASGRELLLFDEPTSGLDYAHMKSFGKLMTLLKEKGKTIVVVTHDEELIKYCDNIINL